MRQYARHLKGRVDEGKLAGSTINTYWNYIAAFLGWCVYEELLAENPARKRRAEEELPDKRPRSDRQQFWSQNDREALLAHLNKRAHAAVDKQGLDAIKELRDRALASLLAYSGVRGAEVLRDPNDQRRGGIRWRDVDLEAGTLVVLGKNQTDEEAPVPPQVRDPLERLQQALRPVSDEWPVFLTLHRPTLSRTARTALASAGFDAEEIEEAIDGYEWVELYRAYDVVPPALTTNGGRTVMRRVCEDAEISLDVTGIVGHTVDHEIGIDLRGSGFERRPVGSIARNPRDAIAKGVLVAAAVEQRYLVVVIEQFSYRVPADEARPADDQCVVHTRSKRSDDKSSRHTARRDGSMEASMARTTGPVASLWIDPSSATMTSSAYRSRSWYLKYYLFFGDRRRA